MVRTSVPRRSRKRSPKSKETVALRYKAPDAGPEAAAKEFELPLTDAGRRWSEAGEDFRFAAAVAGFGMLLTNSSFKGDLNYELVKELAGEGIGEDPKGYRQEFLELVERAQSVAKKLKLNRKWRQ